MFCTSWLAHFLTFKGSVFNDCIQWILCIQCLPKLSFSKTCETKTSNFRCKAKVLHLKGWSNQTFGECSECSIMFRFVFYTQPGMAGLCWDHWQRRACRRWSAPKLPVPWCHTATPGRPGRPGAPKVSLCEQVVSTTWAQPEHNLQHVPIVPCLAVQASVQLLAGGVLVEPWQECCGTCSVVSQSPGVSRNTRQTQILQIWLFRFFGVMEGHGRSWSWFSLRMSSDVFGLGFGCGQATSGETYPPTPWWSLPDQDLQQEPVSLFGSNPQKPSKT